MRCRHQSDRRRGQPVAPRGPSHRRTVWSRDSTRLRWTRKRGNRSVPSRRRAGRQPSDGPRRPRPGTSPGCSASGRARGWSANIQRMPRVDCGSGRPRRQRARVARRIRTRGPVAETAGQVPGASGRVWWTRLVCSNAHPRFGARTVHVESRPSGSAHHRLRHPEATPSGRPTGSVVHSCGLQRSEASSRPHPGSPAESRAPHPSRRRQGRRHPLRRSQMRPALPRAPRCWGTIRLDSRIASP